MLIGRYPTLRFLIIAARCGCYIIVRANGINVITHVHFDQSSISNSLGAGSLGGEGLKIL